jgi:hypothetical protein
MRGSIPNEDTPCVAGRAILTKISNERFPDVRRKRKLVVITSLPTHCEYSGPPVDIVEFQANDFARTEPQTGQKQKKCIIPATDRGAPIAGLDYPFDFVRLQVLRYFRQSPSCHRRKGPCEVTLGLSGAEEKPAERTQRRHHQLRCSRITGTSMPQHETGNVVRGESPNTHRALSKTFHQELSDEAPISRTCSWTKTAFLPEIVFIPLLQCCKRGLVDGWLRRRDNALPTQML